MNANCQDLLQVAFVEWVDFLCAVKMQNYNIIYECRLPRCLSWPLAFVEWVDFLCAVRMQNNNFIHKCRLPISCWSRKLSRGGFKPDSSRKFLLLDDFDRPLEGQDLDDLWRWFFTKNYAECRVYTGCYRAECAYEMSLCWVLHCWAAKCCHYAVWPYVECYSNMLNLVTCSQA